MVGLAFCIYSRSLLYKILICIRRYYIDNYKPFLLIFSIFEYTKGMLCNYGQKKKLHFFHYYFFNIDISLIVPLKCLKFYIHVGREVGLKILIKILVFVLLYVEDGTLQKNRKNLKSFFLLKKKAKT